MIVSLTAAFSYNDNTHNDGLAVFESSNRILFPDKNEVLG
jgi:hypothetical protein